MLTPAYLQSQTLLERATLYRLLAQCFSYPSSESKKSILAALSKLRSTQDYKYLGLEKLRRAWHDAEIGSLLEEYSRLFLGNNACAMRETAYGDGRRIAGRATELADINGFYQAFQLGPTDENPDLPDHLICELEFVSLLLVKHAYARERRAKAQERIVRTALNTFLEDHLGRWVSALGTALLECSPSRPYREAARVLDRLIHTECKRRAIRPQPTTGLLPQDAMQADEFTCPRADT